MTKIQYELREKDLLAFNDHQMKSVESARKILNRHQAMIPGMLGLIAAFVWFYYQDSLTAGVIAVTACVWGFGAPFFIKWSTRRRILGMYSEEDKKRILGEYTLRVEPHALIEVSGAGESRIRWEDVLRIEAAKNYAFIFVGRDSAVIVPRATVKSGDIREFFNEVDLHIEKAA